MIYAILLDALQGQVEPEEYAVTYSSDSLEDCRAQTSHDGGFKVWAKADFRETGSEPTELETPTGVDKGRIVGLEEVAALFKWTRKALTLPVAIGVATGLVVGLAVGRSKRRSGRRGSRS